jgi:hypothetical protein
MAIKQNFPSHVGVGRPIKTTSHKLSNSAAPNYGAKLHSNSHTKFTSPVATPDSTPAAARVPALGGGGKGHGTNAKLHGHGGPKG